LDAITNDSSLWKNYDFKTTLARYQQVQSQITSPEWHHEWQVRQTCARLLADLKAQLIADFAARPYPEPIQTTGNPSLTGRVIKIDDSGIVLKSDTGETPVAWSNISPATLADIGEYNLVTLGKSLTPSALGQRYLNLAVFYRQYPLGVDPTKHAHKALDLSPDLKEEIHLIFGKLGKGKKKS
jgi:hypothetical protein